MSLYAKLMCVSIYRTIIYLMYDVNKWPRKAVSIEQTAPVASDKRRYQENIVLIFE